MVICFFYLNFFDTGAVNYYTFNVTFSAPCDIYSTFLLKQYLKTKQKNQKERQEEEANGSFPLLNLFVWQNRFKV